MRTIVRNTLALALVLALAAGVPARVAASYAFYVGRALSADGTVLIGGTGEEVSSHWLEVVPARVHDPDATVEVGVTSAANIPGERIRIPQARQTFRYLTMNYTDYKGFPPPLTNGGLNEHGVAVRDVWAPSRRELVEMTPVPQRGVTYSDLARLVVERARTAREGVAMIGELIARHGYATYGGNTHLVADPREGWVVWELAGGRGLWAAEKLRDDEVRVLYPGYIGEVPADYMERDDFMGSENLISFAVEQGWYDPSSGEPFHVHRVYGRQGVPMRNPPGKFATQATLESDLRKLAPVTLEDMMAAVRDPRIADDEAGYGQVASLRPGIPGDLRLLWVAPTGSVTTPFVPWRLGVEEVPPEFGQHRYLTKQAASTFLSTDFQAQEATRFAGRVFKRLMYHVLERPEELLPEVTETLVAWERRCIEEQGEVEEVARTLRQAGRGDLAHRAMTFYCNTRAMDALRLGEALLTGIEARVKALHGIRRPGGTEINHQAAPDRQTVNGRTSITGLPGREIMERVGTTATRGREQRGR